VKRSSRPVVPAALALAVAGLTACSVTNQQTTQLEYQPADGEQVDLGGVGVYSMLLIAASAEEPGNLIARVVNSTGEPQTVTLVGTGAAAFETEVEVEPNETLDVGPEGEQVLVEPAGEIPGRLVPVVVSVGEETEEVTIPVLDGTFEYYADLVPEATTG